MLDVILEGEALEKYKNEEFELKIYKSKGMNKPGLRYKGSQHGLLAAYAQLVELSLKEEVVPAKIMHDLLILIAEDLGQVTCEDESK
jgi:hypothetical protein